MNSMQHISIQSILNFVLEDFRIDIYFYPYLEPPILLLQVVYQKHKYQNMDDVQIILLIDLWDNIEDYMEDWFLLR